MAFLNSREAENNTWRLKGWDPYSNQKSIHYHTYGANYPASLSHIRLQPEDEDKNDTSEISKRPGQETL